MEQPSPFPAIATFISSIGSALLITSSLALPAFRLLRKGNNWAKGLTPRAEIAGLIPLTEVMLLLRLAIEKEKDNVKS